MNKESSKTGDTRRSFLLKFGGGVIGASVLASFWMTLRSLIPNVLYEPPQKFKIGKVESFPEGITFIEDRRIYLFREGNSFHAISGVCSHLGCTVKYSHFNREQELTVRNHTYISRGEFHCPCHGSKFRDEGTNYSGPAPRALKWYNLVLSPDDDQLLVNMAHEVERDFRLVV